MTTVLITRPKVQAQATRKWLEADGFRALEAPVLRIEATGTAVDWEGAAAIAITSANAVPAIAEAPPELPIFAVGPATAAALAAADRPALVTGDGDGADLGRLIGEHLRAPGDAASGVVLHPTGVERSPTLEKALGEAGLAYRSIAVYRAQSESALPKAVSAALDRGEVSAVLLYSSRSMQLFEELLASTGRSEAARGLTALCLSQAVAAAAALPWASLRAASKPNEAALRVLLEDLRR